MRRRWLEPGQAVLWQGLRAQAECVNVSWRVGDRGNSKAMMAVWVASVRACFSWAEVRVDLETIFLQ